MIYASWNFAVLGKCKRILPDLGRTHFSDPDAAIQWAKVKSSKFDPDSRDAASGADTP